MNQNQGISVIICCYNSSSRIKATLEHLVRQKTDNSFRWEIILIDNNSSDDTSNYSKDIWKSFQTKIPLKIFTEKEQGLIFAKKRGIQEAQFNLLLFCDDDNWLAENYISTAYSFMFKNKKTGLIGGKGNPVFEKNFIVPAWFEEAAQFHYATHSPNIDRRDDVHVYGAGSIIRKEIFSLLQEYNYDFILSGRSGNQIISGEDIETRYLSKILGYEVKFIPTLQFNHFLPKEKISESWITKKIMDIYSPFIIMIYRDYHSKEIKSFFSYYLFVFKKWFKLFLISLKKTLYLNWGFYSKLWFKSQLKSCSFLLGNYNQYKKITNDIQQLHHKTNNASIERIN